MHKKTLELKEFMIGELEEKLIAKDGEIMMLRKKIATVLAEHNIKHAEFSAYKEEEQMKSNSVSRVNSLEPAYKEGDNIKSDSVSRVNSLELKSRSKSPFNEDRHGHIS